VIAGYACFNDGSIRDWQRKSGGQFTLGKGFDGTGGFGPDIVTSDELPKGGAPLRIMTRVNGEVMQDSNTDDLIFDVPRLVAELSEVLPLLPGDVIFTGTPAGVGFTSKPPRFLQAGEVLETWIEGIGTISNDTIAEKPRPPMMARAIGKYAGPWPLPPTCASPIASGSRPSSVVRTVIRIGRRRSRPACRIASCRGSPAWRRSMTCAISTMPMLTTTPISTMNPIIAIIVIVVPVTVRNQIEPTLANRDQGIIHSG